MGFFSSLEFCKRLCPVVVNTGEVDRLVAGLGSLNAISPGLFKIQLKHGQRVDKDKKETYELVEVSPGIAKAKYIAWDIDRTCNSIDDIHSQLTATPKPLYRAHLMLGEMAQDLIAHCHPVNPPENDQHFAPDGWGLTVGPVNGGKLANDDEKFLGWISLSMSGYGYLYPLSESQFIERAVSHPTIRAAAALCCSIWPSEGPTDWHWFVSETG